MKEACMRNTMLILILCIVFAGCADKKPIGSNPPVSVPGGGTVNGPPSDGIKVPGK
jgi:hypothetical protein